MKRFFREAFDSVIAQTDLPETITEPLFRDMEAAYPSSSRGMEQAAEKWIGDTDWAWHWFNDWRAIFAETKKWPTNAAWSWFQSGPETPRDRERQRKEKLYLLAHTIHWKAFRLFRMNQLADLMQSWPGRYKLIVEPDDCKHARDAARRFNKGEIKDIPPYYPGDRSDLGVLDSRRTKKKKQASN